MSDYYILDGHTPVPCDLMAWAQWFETADRQVALTKHELFRVSTVFLGINYQFGRGPPILFETMAFADDSMADLECYRYATWEDAEIGHVAAVRRMLDTVRVLEKGVKPWAP